MSILDKSLATLQALGLPQELSYLALVAGALLVLFALYKLVMMIIQKLRPEQSEEKKENFPSMADLVESAKKAASDAVAGAKKLVGA